MSWIKANHMFDDRSALLIVGERDAREVGDLLRDNQESLDVLQEKLSGIINRCRPELVGHVIWFIEFSTEFRAWKMYVNHASLPRTPLYAVPAPQMLRLDDALPWTAPTKTTAGIPLKEMADEPITVS